MRKPSRNRALWALCLSLFFALGALSCSDDEPGLDPAEEDSVIFFLLSPNGPGDNGYNDMIVKGLSAFNFHEEANLHLLSCESYEEAKAYYTELLELNASMKERRMLIVLASSLYESLLTEATEPVGKGEVLLFESARTDLSERVHCLSLNRYGVCYLAGAMVSNQPAEIVAALPDEPILQEAIDGFKAGYAAHNPNRTVPIHYLANDHSGFNQQGQAYRWTQERMNYYLQQAPSYCTFVPLAGSSNLGVYNAVNQLIAGQQAIGMDINCNDQNDYIPFSILFHVDQLIQDYLTRWQRGETLPRQERFGLSSNYVEVVCSATWDPLSIFVGWDDLESIVQLPDDFWAQKLALYQEEAKQKEVTHEKE